jgi:hypothetical protein
MRARGSVWDELIKDLGQAPSIPPLALVAGMKARKHRRLFEQVLELSLKAYYPDGVKAGSEPVGVESGLPAGL